MFTNDDLEMITAIGRIVGVAVENATLHREMVTNERLAAIGQATAGIGHCVKNMLVGVKSGSDFLDMAVAEKNWSLAEKGRGMLAASTERIENLVLNLLAFSRDYKLEPLETHLDGLLDDLVRLMQPRAEKVGVTLTFHRGEIGPFHLDGQQMYRVLLNLITNAIEACEENGGEVTLFSRRNAEGCFVDIVDTGVGIPKDIHPKLFHAFVSSKGSQGTGLGLACSDKIVRAHGGIITVQSTLGEGSTFTVFLPAQPNQPTHAKRVEGATPE
jgi:signal transduction histidine kinase